MGLPWEYSAMPTETATQLQENKDIHSSSKNNFTLNQLFHVKMIIVPVLLNF